MSSANLFATRKKAFDLKAKTVDSTYTVNVGGVSDNFYEDGVIKIVDPTANFTITVPAGKYEGQELLITLTAHASSSVTITIDLSKGTDVALGDLGDYTHLEWVNATVGWVPLSAVTD